MATALGAIAFVLLLLFAIFFHEFGHFVTARWAGIKVSRFFVGFGPTVWSIRRGHPETVVGKDGTATVRPETEYGIKLLPLGGFVKVVGMSPFEEVDPMDEPRAFGSAPAYKRAIVLAAGSATHFITAIVVLFLMFTFSGFLNPTLQIDSVEKSIGKTPAPAFAAGLRPGDRILAVNDKPVDSWDEVRTAIRDHPGVRIGLRVERTDGTHELEVTPVTQTERDAKIGVIGVIPKQVIRRANPISATRLTFSAVGHLITGFFRSAPHAFAPSTLGLRGGGPANDRPFSILGAVRLSADLASHGQFATFLALFVSINVFIAVFNMMPLPPLDGGHLIVLAIEKIRGKRIGERALLPVMAVVFGVLIILVVLLVYYDIVSPVHVPIP